MSPIATPPRGIIPPIATPMQANEDLDLPRLRWFVDHLIQQGIHAAFVLGTNGEAYALTEEEKQAVVAAAVEAAAGRVPVWVGTGAITTRATQRLTRMAEKEGAHGVTVITPYFVHPSQTELFDHYRRVAEPSSLPVLLYNNPAHTHLTLHPETVARLAEMSQIVGIKDSSGDLSLMLDYIRLAPSRFSVLQGRDSLIYSALELGAKGAVPASGNLVPAWCVEIFEAFERGDREAAKSAQLKVHPLRKALALGTAPGVLKPALRLMGIDLGPARSPLGALSLAELTRLRAVLVEAGLASAASLPPSM